jgi:hypothetical protein
MLIKGRPLGIWILAVWAGAHTIPGALVAEELSGTNSFLAWLLVVAEVAVAGGLIVRWRFARYLLMAQVALNVLLFAVVAWALVFVAAAWGLHATDTPAVLLLAGYLLFACWAFLYLFHPGVEEYFATLAGEPID